MEWWRETWQEEAHSDRRLDFQMEFYGFDAAGERYCIWWAAPLYYLTRYLTKEISEIEVMLPSDYTISSQSWISSGTKLRVEQFVVLSHLVCDYGRQLILRLSRDWDHKQSCVVGGVLFHEVQLDNKCMCLKAYQMQKHCNTMRIYHLWNVITVAAILSIATTIAS